MKRVRIYADTSVFGGCFDSEFKLASIKFFEDVRSGRFTVVISDVTTVELTEAPEFVRQVLTGLPEDQVEAISVDDEVMALRDA